MAANPTQNARETARELAIIEAIKKGQADVRAGRTTPHEQVMAEADALIQQADVRAGRTTPHEQVMAEADALIQEAQDTRRRKP